MKEGVNTEFLAILGRVPNCSGMASWDKRELKLLSWDASWDMSQDAQDGGGFLRVV